MTDASSSLSWVKHDAKPLGNKPENMPCPRSGHSMTVIGTNCYIFGGLNGASIDDPTDIENDIVASNDLYRLKLGSGGMEWIRVTPRGSNPSPLPRWQHTATLFEGLLFIYFSCLFYCNN